jgi:uncharacterized membrane protein AbrB (regulator of aidB expression)
MSVLGILAVIFLMAFLVEALVEYVFGKPFDHVEILKPYKWLLMYIALAVGVAGAFIYQFDVIHLLSDWLKVPIAVHPFGMALTGLMIGRGSNFVHDVIKKFFQNDPLG